MKNYLAIFLGHESESKMEKWNSMDEATKTEKVKTGVAAWKNWVEKNQKSIVTMGSPLGKTMVASNKGISSTKNRMTAFTVVKADSHEAATKLFEGHPHFSIFPGECIEVMECMPIPEGPKQ